MITLDQLKKLCPANKQPEALLVVLNDILPKYEINTKKRVAAFLAQAGHESAQFTTLKENLNYSAEGLCKVWPKRFTSLAMAKPYNRNPEKIANKVYADRMGNGSEASGDGFKFKGVGVLQLTGKDNYSRFAQSIGKSLDETVVYLTTLSGACESACWFWTVNKLNQFADSGDFTTLTKRINGGTIGLADRQKHFDEAMKVISDDVFTKSAPVVATVISTVIVAPIIEEEHPIADEHAIEKNDDFLDDICNWFNTPLF
jgi:putative chitinase